MLSASAIVAENLLPGNPPSEWDVVGSGDASIQGYATDISVDQGATIEFKVNNPNLASYRLDIYRIGYYGGDGARWIDTVPSSETLRQSQPAPLTDSATGLVDAGNWSVSASWDVPADAVSGIYIAKAIREDTGGASHIIFVVRDDDGASELLFQTADTTWQAYNAWGGNSLYRGEPDNRAYAVSYNRPFETRETNAKDWFFSSEYAMVRWLERNGYDVSYSTGVDSDRSGEEILEHDVFLSVGHDEYWSGAQRANVEAARDAGVHLAFFSGNEVYWKTRWEDSLDGTATPHRSLISYKETWANAKIDPEPGVWTGTWRDDRFSPPADGGYPENALTGQIFTVNRGPGGERGTPITVGSEFADLRFWRDTRVADLLPGQSTELGDYVLGYEWDEDLDNGFRPAGLVGMSSTTQFVPQKIDAYGGPTVTSGEATHSLTLYRADSGALVFGAGTIHWAWGLDGNHDLIVSTPDPAIQQATVNLFADMGVQPASLASDLVLASASTDFVAPTSSITSLVDGAEVVSGVPLELSGTAIDSGGGIVAGVEVSVDGGVTWHRADRGAVGGTTWTYDWSPTTIGTVTVYSRAVDDSANLEQATTGIAIDVLFDSGSLWDDSYVPTLASASDSSAVELGVRFQTTNEGNVTGLRFYKGAANTGTHVGRLWTENGTLLGSVTFTSETATGWQQAEFSTPILLAANTNYIASYLAPNGGYSVDLDYFANSHTRGPLTAPANGDGGANGLYLYGTGGGFPTSVYQATNYWVDVVFETVDLDPPTVDSWTPAPGAVEVSGETTVQATFDESVQAESILFLLRDPAGSEVAASVSYDEATRTVTLTPDSLLAENATYTATLSGVTDLAGNTMTTSSSSFTTAAPIVNDSLWTLTTVPTVDSVDDTAAVELGVKFRADRDGFITGLRFYKGPTNTGTHIGNLWSSAGTLLASATFTSESSSGWQEVVFAAPVAVSADTTYVASYYAPAGGYAFDIGYFALPWISGSLRGLSTSEAGGNGVYRYGSSSGFPTDTYNAANYWIDVVFTTHQEVHQVTFTDFTIGSHNDTVGIDMGGGELQLATAFLDQFGGTSLAPSDWATTVWSSESSTNVQNGMLTVLGAQVASQSTYISPAVEGSLQFGGSSFQHFGLATGLASVSGNHWAIFSTGETNDRLFARVNASGVTQQVDLGPLPTGYHDYQIRPTTNGFAFSIDGVLQTTITTTFPDSIPMRIVVSDYNGVPATGLKAEMVRLLNVTAPSDGSGVQSGLYQSIGFDAGQTADWQSVNWQAETLGGTGLTVRVRVSELANFTGAPWVLVTAGQNLQDLGLQGRYLQYQVTLTTVDDLLSPRLFDIGFTWL